MGDDESAASHISKKPGVGQQSTLRDWPYRQCLAQARLKEFDGDLTLRLTCWTEAQRLYVRSLTPYTRPIDALRRESISSRDACPKRQMWVHERGLSIEHELSYLHEFEHITLARVLIAEYQSNQDERAIANALTLLDRLLKAAEDQQQNGQPARNPGGAGTGFSGTRG